MSFPLSIAITLVFATIVFWLGKSIALTRAGAASEKTESLPRYYGYCASLWSGIPALLLLFFIFYIGRSDSEVSFIKGIIPVALLLLLAVVAIYFIKPNFKAREHVEKWMKYILVSCAVISVSITFLIVGSILFESLRFFEKVPFTEFLFGTHWSPQTAIRADQAGSSGSFGAVPVFAGTLLITLIAMIIAAPLGLFSAIYLTEYASPRTRDIVKPVLELLAGIPTVVYGYFAAVTFSPFLREMGSGIGLDIASESAFAAGVVMGVMIIPFVMSLSDDVMNAVPQSLRDASMGLGATKSETIIKVVVPAALPGVMGALLLAISRAIGETMIVVMAAGLAANLTANPFEAVTTVTAQIVSLLTGDQEFDSEKTLAAFGLSLTLFVMTLMLNVIALIIVKKYREKYE